MADLIGKDGNVLALSAEPGHRVIETWMGAEVLTLEDLLREELRAVCVGINPSPVSVARGHYYQGVLGRRFFGRLREVGLAPDDPTGGEDDAAFAAGVGFTDIIKRPTARATDLRPDEFKHGRAVLVDKLEQFAPQLVIFTFAAAAKGVFGRFAGNGFVPGLRVGQAAVFVMPGPMESNATARPTLVDLGEWARS